MKKRLIIIAVAIALSAMLVTGCVEKTSAAASTASAPAVKAESAGTTQVVVSGQTDLRNSIGVSAEAQVKVMPDVAYVTAGVVSRNAKLKDANTDNRTKMDAIYKALNDQGITKDNIKTSGYSESPVYDYSSGTGKLTGYEVTNTIEITVNNIDTVGDILDVCTTAGANTAYPVTFDLKDKTASYNEALKQAVEKAKAKADVAAKAAGVTLGKLMKLSEGGITPSPVYAEATKAARDEAAGAPPATIITAGELTITADVSLLYEVNQ